MQIKLGLKGHRPVVVVGWWVGNHEPHHSYNTVCSRASLFTILFIMHYKKRCYVGGYQDK